MTELRGRPDCFYSVVEAEWNGHGIICWSPGNWLETEVKAGEIN